MLRFESEFHSLAYVIRRARRILLVAHNRPDADTVGANSALAEHLLLLGKHVDIACQNHFPDALKPLGSREFHHPNQLDLASYEVIIACDSVDRGFDCLLSRFSPDQVTIVIDHHPNIALNADIVIMDPEYSSASEILFHYFTHTEATITKEIATQLLMGILFDTGSLQHASVSARVLDIVSELIKRGAPLQRIVQTIFSNHSIAALKLWGKAFEKARYNPGNGMLVTAITRQDVAESGACVDDIYQVTSILSTVPDAKFSLVLSELDGGVVRASLRSMEQHGVDVSVIAKRFGGGGHRLASGFEIPGKIIETENGWIIT